ncbi:PPPDE putative peptidase domain-containing protein [Emericellopsis atlantica]|uniref:PPPDE putative peptidase domain-containing protein n=1 Tax=Emericellopsis atlantica TaxID=2614577 RepID=A0A9P7ZK55_9HYPO|nr:PPPDE putative peptidase domain-containing protein [Emericellopsis atlantica]KAG9253480.1 PPPDE putative peptidase domain-containing protein [Emericellopsis atlantica]
MPRQSRSGSSRQSANRHRSTLSLQKTEIIINVYDLLPAGRLSSVLWTVGASLLHSGVVINGKEYAFGGHDHPGVTGVYWTKPKTEPPGGTFKCELLHGFTLASDEEIEAAIRTASEEFQGTSYNLLTKNCNHFTSYLVNKLTGTPGPGWLNRAASIGVAFPCVVPREWIDPPEYDTADGELLRDEDESSRMLRNSDEMPQLVRNSGQQGDDRWESDEEAAGGRRISRDTSGRMLPASERAPAR